MKSLLLLPVLLLSACGHVAPGEIWIAPEPTQNACLHTWAVAQAAWKERLPLGLECANLDADVSIELTDPSRMPCAEAAGCTVGDTMYLRNTLSDTQAISVATHEWIHVLARCELKDGDANHTDTRLWAATDPAGMKGNTVEAIAVRNEPYGSCLD